MDTAGGTIFLLVSTVTFSHILNAFILPLHLGFDFNYWAKGIQIVLHLFRNQIHNQLIGNYRFFRIIFGINSLLFLIESHELWVIQLFSFQWKAFSVLNLKCEALHNKRYEISFPSNLLVILMRCETGVLSQQCWPK